MRLAELVGTLSIATDAGVGLPDHHALRSAVLAVGLAEVAKADDRTRRDAYHLPLLAMSGCTAESNLAAEAIGDEVALGGEAYGLDWGRPAAMVPAMLRVVRRGLGPLEGTLAMARAVSKLPSLAEMGRAHCEVAVHLAERFGFDERFRAALFQMFERWDGSGQPRRIRGEAIAFAARIARVAVDANVGHRLGGVDGAIRIVRDHARKGLDPELVERFVRRATELCVPLDDPSPWTVAMNAEPSPQLIADGESIDEGLRAIAHFADLKSRHTRGHSSGVALLARAAAAKVGLDAQAQTLLFRAGLVHDVGRVAVSAAIWDKVTPLTDAERERIRLHSYVGERILSRAPALTAVNEIASLTHERLDGSGYHRRLPAAACASAPRILAATDVYRALREDRPHRSALDEDQAASELTAMVRTSSLCPDAVAAVLGAAGHAIRAPERPGGLTDREAQVLDLLARGLTNKEIASALGISAKTAGHHVQHVLEKLGVTTRAAATMVAMKAGLVRG